MKPEFSGRLKIAASGTLRGGNGLAEDMTTRFADVPVSNPGARAAALPKHARRLPIGAEPQLGGGTHFRVWAPSSPSVSVELYGSERGGKPLLVPLEPEANGYFSGAIAEAQPGMRYRFRLESGVYPDPASRFQPEGPHGPSEIVDPSAFVWTDQEWRGRPVDELVIYELHLGTFTAEGSWRSAMAELPALGELGVTMIEVMPIADFSGQFGWGYDGVDLFAPCRLYGRPDDARAFVNRAHELGIAVILDVVYNHLGPDGNFLRPFSKDYFSEKHRCEWGEALNFDGENAAGTREFFVSNARYWIEEFHFDGLRLDATQQIFDDSPKHVIREIAETVRRAGGRRQIYLVGENEPQEPKMARSYSNGGYGLSAVWNDDFHHSAMIAATGRIEAYYSDYRGTPQEFISAAKRGFLYQGQWYVWQKKRRGEPAFDLSAKNFVVFLQNHDQVANSLRGLRLHQETSPGLLKALTAVLLLSPSTPMLFQGQEFAASAPFLYFADHNPELNGLVREGRQGFLRQFRTVACDECREIMAEPGDRSVFERCRLDFSEREKHAHVYALHRDLLRVRRETPAIAKPAAIDGAVLSNEAFLLRYFAEDGDDRLLLVNLGRDLFLPVAPEPLLAPLRGKGWTPQWSSESPQYGGCGTPPLETTQNWIIPGHSAVLLRPHDNADLAPVRFSEKD